MLKDARFRYLLVGGFCAGVHNAIMIGGGLLGAHYVASSVVSFCLVLVLGFVLHARFTFAVHADWRSFAKYAAGMLINLPLWIGLMYVLAGLCRLPMIVASPLGTIMFVGWNFLVSRWAIAHRRPPRTPRAIDASAPDAKQGRLSES
jgi:putative flippase GtrA